jgi:hypothetical protein
MRLIVILRAWATLNARACRALRRRRWSGHETESVYLRYAIVSETDLSDTAIKLAALQAGDAAKAAESNVVVMHKADNKC